MGGVEYWAVWGIKPNNNQAVLELGRDLRDLQSECQFTESVRCGAEKRIQGTAAAAAEPSTPLLSGAQLSCHRRTETSEALPATLLEL